MYVFLLLPEMGARYCAQAFSSLGDGQPFAVVPRPLRSNLPVDMLLPVLWRGRGIRIGPGEDDVPFTLIHHTACLLIVIERHRGGYDCLHIYWDI